MVIKVAVPHQFKLKVIPDFRSLFFSDKKDIHYIGDQIFFRHHWKQRKKEKQYGDWGQRMMNRQEKC